MDPNPITRAIIDSTVDRGIREIDEDPRRSLRKLTDLWRMFNRGRFLDEIFELFQDLLRNEDSPYYTAIESILRNSDRQVLRAFGANIGYNSFTVGGRTIRELESGRDYRIPSAVVMRINPSLAESLTVSEIDSCIKQGLTLGIYMYIIRVEGSLACMNRLLQMFRSHPECAFFCLLPDSMLHSEHLNSIRSLKNAAFMVKAFTTSTEPAVAALQKQKSLCGVYDVYDDSDAADWISGRRVRDISRYGCSFAVSVPADSCSREAASDVAAHCRSMRMQPKYPLFLFDMNGDLMKINRVISDEEAFFELLENGDIRTDHDNFSEFRHTTNLEKLFSIALPRS